MEVHERHAEPWRVTLVDTGRETPDRRPPEAGARLCRRRDLLFHLRRRPDRRRHRRPRRLSSQRREARHADRNSAAGPLRRRDIAGAADHALRGKAGRRRRLDQRRLLRPRARRFDLHRGRRHVWEGEPLEQLAHDGQLYAYAHTGFWQAMDTLRDKNQLEELWAVRQRTLESLVMTLFGDAYRGRRVLVTGHTGFKGSWLALWLQQLGADVTGMALPADTTPSHWGLLGLASPSTMRTSATAELARRDVASSAARDRVPPGRPAAGARQSYRGPAATWSTNVMGTANVLEACRARTPSVRASWSSPPTSAT